MYICNYRIFHAYSDILALVHHMSTLVIIVENKNHRTPVFTMHIYVSYLDLSFLGMDVYCILG